MTNNQQTNTKATKLGSYSAFLTLVVLAIVIVVNLMVGELPSTITKLDNSSLKLYTLSDTSISLVEGLTEDVTMYYIVQNGTEDANIQEMLSRYASYSSRITVKTVDPTSNPGFSSKYTDDTLSGNSVIVESAKRSSVVPYEAIYTTEYSEEDIYNYYMTGVMPSGTSYFNGESQLTTAIDFVTSDNLPTIYIVTGHGETALDETILADTKAENILTEEFTLLTATKIPEDAGAVLMNAPTVDITETEADVLRNYMAGGGRLILTTAFDSFSKEKMPNLSALTEEYGLVCEPGLLLEGDQNHYYAYPYTIVPTLNTEADVTANLSSGSITTIVSLAHGIRETENTDKLVEPILSTSDKAYVKADYQNMTTGDKEDGDASGTFMLGAYAEDTASGGKLVWFASPTFLDVSYYTYNGELFMSTLTVLCEKESSISILGKALQVQSLMVSAASAGFWGAVMILILPIGCVVTGLVIWNKRRKR